MIGVKLMSILQIKDVLIIPLNLYMITITVLNVMTQNNIETITLAPVTLGMNVQEWDLFLMISQWSAYPHAQRTNTTTSLRPTNVYSVTPSLRTAIDAILIQTTSQDTLIGSISKKHYTLSVLSVLKNSLHLNMAINALYVK